MKNNKAPKLINNIKKRLIENVEIPNEIVLNLPLITIVGKNKIVIENFKNIVLYSTDIIKINTSSGIFKINGKNLYLKTLNKNKIFIKGIINSTEFI